MANKNKANDAILMAILQDIQGNSTASTSAMLQADIKRDGADKQDIQRKDKSPKLFAGSTLSGKKIRSILTKLTESSARSHP